MLNPFENPVLVEDYEAWYETTGRRTDRLEKALLQRLLAGFPTVQTLLEVGCGTGHFTRWFQERGLQAVGLDVSTPMLAEANRLGRPPCVHSDTLSLPFSNNAMDIVAVITTLEFIPEPVLALAEAFRVTLLRTNPEGPKSPKYGWHPKNGCLRASSSSMNDQCGKFREKGIEAHRLVEHNPVVETIIDVTTRQGADLIAMTNHGRGGLSLVFYGSVAASVLQRIDRSLLLFHSRGQA